MYDIMCTCVYDNHACVHVCAFVNVNRCVNRFADGDRIVFRRPTPSFPVRGSSAKRRTQKFEWTIPMSKWLHNKTHNLSRKCIPFTQLVFEAEMQWGYKAPQQEHLENKIASRDAARKKGAVVKWVRDILES